MTSLPEPYQRQPPQAVQRERLLAAIRSLGLAMHAKPITIASVIAQMKKRWEKG